MRILLAALLLLGASLSVQAKELNELECYPSVQSARAEHPTGHLRVKKLKDSLCWHLGHYRPDSFIVMKAGPKKSGSKLSSDGIQKKTLHLKDWSKARPISVDENYAIKYTIWEWSSPW